MAIADHHPEVSAPTRKRDAEQADEQPVDLGNQGDRVVGVKRAVKRSTCPLAIQRGFGADPSILGGDLLEQRECSRLRWAPTRAPARSVALFGAPRTASVAVAPQSEGLSTLRSERDTSRRVRPHCAGTPTPSDTDGCSRAGSATDQQMR